MIFRETIEFIWEALHPIHMPIPTSRQLKEGSEKFYRKTKFPHCDGSIDTKQVKIKRPANTMSQYFNYKKYYSVVLQGVADADCKFIAIDVGGYGRQSDGGTFMASEFYDMLTRGQLPIPQPDELPNSRLILPYVFVGDAAYPLMENLMKPFPGQNLTRGQTIFNARLSAARRTIECAFGILTMKWQILLKTIQQEPLTANAMIKCMCVLHNTIIDCEGNFKLIEELRLHRESQTIQVANRPILNNRRVGLGKEVRNEIMAYLLSQRKQV